MCFLQKTLMFLRNTDIKFTYDGEINVIIVIVIIIIAISLISAHVASSVGVFTVQNKGRPLQYCESGCLVVVT